MRTPLPFNPLEEDRLALENLEPQYTHGESIAASFDLAMQDTFVMSLARNNSLDELKNRGGTLLTPEKANEMYPGLPVPFREEIHPFAAQEIYDRHQERQDLERRIRNGPDTFGMGIARFGAGIVAHIMDPVETGLSFLGGFAVRAALPGIAAAGRATQIGTDIGVNLVENVISENLVRDAAIDEQQEYDAVDFMTNVGVGAFAFPLLGEGVRQAARGARFANGKVSEFFSGKSPEVQAKAVEMTINRMQDGKLPDVGTLKKAVIAENDFKPDDGIAIGGKAYEFNDAYGVPKAGKTYYVPVKDAGDLSSAVGITDSVGKGIQATDNPELANGILNSSLGDAGGTVREVKLNSNEIIDFRDTVPSKVRVDGVDLEGKTIGESIELIKEGIADGRVKEDALEDFTRGIEEAGFKAISSDGAKSFGESRSPHNELHVLDESVLDLGRELEPDPSLVRKSMPEFGSVEPKDAVFNMETIREFEREFVEGKIETRNDFKEIEDTVNTFLEDLQEARKQGLVDSPEFDSIMDAIREIDDLDTMAKAAQVCVGRNG